MPGEGKVNFESVLSAVAAGQSPGQGSAQNDIYTYDGDVAVGFPLNCNYVIAGNYQRLLAARLSIKLLPYRTYNTFASALTGVGSAHAHSHNHSTHVHSLTISGGVGGSADMIWDSFNTKINKTSVGNVVDSSTVVATTPTTDATAEAAHTHPLAISSVLGVFEGVSATGVTVTIDGVDHTADLGGPFNTDQVELNLAKFLPVTTKLFHTVALVGTGLGRIQAILRVTYFVNGQIGS